MICRCVTRYHWYLLFCPISCPNPGSCAGCFHKHLLTPSPLLLWALPKPFSSVYVSLRQMPTLRAGLRWRGLLLPTNPSWWCCNALNSNLPIPLVFIWPFIAIPHPGTLAWVEGGGLDRSLSDRHCAALRLILLLWPCSVVLEPKWCPSSPGMCSFPEEPQSFMQIALGQGHCASPSLTWNYIVRFHSG
jgi:hypothetical protein